MEGLELDVLCVGNAAWDVVMEIPRQPGPDEKIEAEGALACGGGPAANAAVCVARLGLRVGFAGYLSHDVYGQAHLAELRHEGVDVSLVSFGEAPIRVASIYVKPDGRRSIVHHSMGSHPMQLELVTKVPWRARVVLFDGYEPELADAVWQRVEAVEPPARPITVLDAGSVRPVTRRLAPEVDHLVASAAFAREYTGRSELDAALEDMVDLAPNLVITRGGEGALWARSAAGTAGAQEHGATAAFPARVVDTTGAGDAFHAGYAAALAQGLEWDEVLAWAGACGTLACTKLGARPSMPDRASLERALADR